MKAGILKMNTIISKIDIKNIDKNEIKKQAELIKEGKTVIFPTETVYGLGANALDENAVKKIDGVTNVSVSFIKQKMDLEAPDDKFDAIFAEAKNLIKKIEPDVTVKL